MGKLVGARGLGGGGGGGTCRQDKDTEQKVLQQCQRGGPGHSGRAPLFSARDTVKLGRFSWRERGGGKGREEFRPAPAAASLASTNRLQCVRRLEKIAKRKRISAVCFEECCARKVMCNDENRRFRMVFSRLGHGS